MVHMISYDLNGRERASAYTAVKQVIEANAIDFRRPLYSQWFVETNASPEAWRDALKQVMDSDDNVFVCRVGRQYAGWFSKEIWPWLSARL
jgi:hypothetical protein